VWATEVKHFKDHWSYKGISNLVNDISKCTVMGICPQILVNPSLPLSFTSYRMLAACWSYKPCPFCSFGPLTLCNRFPVIKSPLFEIPSVILLQDPKLLSLIGQVQPLANMPDRDKWWWRAEKGGLLNGMGPGKQEERYTSPPILLQTFSLHFRRKNWSQGKIYAWLLFFFL
jgi:hypothetical protein